ncbi:unnamed protein product [Spirodela intermedia]|uniref:Methyltransferase domain-containing protein n=1 Tax=Spirodela intermedia TaxID=51605 RepID=A0A7I8JF54_SPIIN|nr:unnamed protein product [Spirodela intermedia]CAA6668561.1 unnamed protein product [Spirodela intermedia]
MTAGGRSYSCESADKTMEWMTAIADVLRSFRLLLDAHVTNFFKDRLWETVDGEWMECLRKGPCRISSVSPVGWFGWEHWPATLKGFVKTLKSLVLPRDPKSSNTIFDDFQVAQLGSVLSQGMNQKKKHEVEILSAVVSVVASFVGAATVIDVGAGQGYLSQVLSFLYHLSVIALDASPHHASVTSLRAERIKKHFTVKSRKSQNGTKLLHGPTTITSVLESMIESSSCDNEHAGSPLVLAGLHACGDLSVNMLRTFIECEQVKAIVCISCCYNLLSDEQYAKSDSCSFPMSKGGKLLGLALGRSARDLGCQPSILRKILVTYLMLENRKACEHLKDERNKCMKISEERWRSFTKDAAIQNFELHAFRAAFQLILDKYYPSTLALTPAIGRQGKTLRRRQLRRVLNSQLDGGERSIEFSAKGQCDKESHLLTLQCAEAEAANGHDRDCSCTTSDIKDVCGSSSKFCLFEEFSRAGLSRLGIETQIILTSWEYGRMFNLSLYGLWISRSPFLFFSLIPFQQDFTPDLVVLMHLIMQDLIGPYWALHAALGPLVETYLLLDRLLFLQEQGDGVEVKMVPLFDPCCRRGMLLPNPRR